MYRANSLHVLVLTVSCIEDQGQQHGTVFMSKSANFGPFKMRLDFTVLAGLSCPIFHVIIFV
jgi:hypothetical protein